MAKIFNADEDPNDDPDSLDLDESELYCPKCGCQHAIKITRMPQPGTWMNMNGEAVCTECNIKFPIRLELESDPTSQQGVFGQSAKQPKNWFKKERQTR